ncbi:DEAD/DEAH box helicase (plasmid) [Rhodobacteraceae bacterium SC52]|nr:DEAD/DEAH box helicase [Rhodobacteraceae bacterium SC52]
MIETLQQALAERGYETLTDVQNAVNDPSLSESDLLVSAQTGSGKTVGFGLAIAPTILPDTGRFDRAEAPLALVIAPTRELAFQVMRELSWLYGKAGAVVTTCVGGMDMRDERRALDRGAHIVVATPGRLRDHIQRGSVDLSGLRAVVLDEADEMLDLGFSEDLEFILAAAPDDRRTLMFSATVPPAIASLAKKYQRNAERVQVTGGKGQHADIAYQALSVAQADAENAIINVLRFHDAENAIVFGNTRAMVARLAARFANRGFATVALSGELSQTERTHALQAMRDGRARVCVATDVAARGIDLPGLDLVVHAELPSNPETLLHRSGRTGRAGRKGISALIVPPKSRKKAERILKFAKLTAEWTTAPSADDILKRDEERLLTDASWSDPLNETEAEFAGRLMEKFTAEQIAGAYLRLYRKGVSAPEDLGAPDAAGAPRPPREFGPSVWVSIPVGRSERAEPRWLLPLLCRAGNIDKNAIGAIRVQEKESFVELSQPAMDGFLKALGPDRTLEDGMVLTVLDSKPDIASGPPARTPRPDRAPRRDRDDSPRPERASRPPRTGRPDRPERPEGVVTPYKPRSAPDDAPAARKPRHKAEDGGAPRRKYDDKPARPYGGDKPKPRSAAEGKPAPRKAWDDKAAPRRGPSEGGGGRPDKPAFKRRESGDKPFGKPDRFSKDAKPRRKSEDEAPKARATDTSKRFTPPGAAAGAGRGKPGGKPRGAAPGKGGPRGGNAYPKRGKP